MISARHIHTIRRLGFGLAAAVALVAAPAGAAGADGPTPTACTAAAVRADVQAAEATRSTARWVARRPFSRRTQAATRQLSCVPAGITVSFDGTAAGVTLNAQGASRLFDVSPSASLTLTGVTLFAGAVQGPSGDRRLGRLGRPGRAQRLSGG